MPVGFRGFLGGDDPTVSKLLELLSHLFFIMEEIRVDECVVMTVYSSQVAAEQRLASSAGRFADKAAIDVFTTFR